MKNILRIFNTIFTIFILTLVNKGFSQAPTFTWGKNFSTNNSAIPRSIFVDGSGNVYSVGGYGGTTDFDPGIGVFNLTSNGSSDIFITKLDAAGNFVWGKSIGGSGDDQAKCVAVDASGNVYLTGYYSSVTVDFDPGAGIFSMSNAGGQDIFILKLDVNGNFVWAKKFGNSSGAEEGTGIALDTSNNVYSTGIFYGTMDFDPNAGVFNLSPTSTALYVSKLDVNGNFIFAKECSGNSGVQGMAIKLDGSGNVFTTGVFSGTDDFDPGIGVNNMTSFGSNDVFVLKLDAVGNFVFAKQIGGTSADEAWTIDIDNASNILIGGDFQGTVDFDPGVGTFNITSSGSYDAFVCKLNSTGNFVWSKSLGGGGTEKIFSIGTDILNNVYSVGQFQNTADFDPGAGVYNLTASIGLDGFINKLDSLGTFIWTGQIEGTSSEMIQTMRIDQNSNLHFGGQYTGTTDLDAGAGAFTITASNNDAFLCKYAACTIPSQPGTILGATTICSGSSNTYSVSAVAGATSYIWSLPGGWSGTSSINSISTTASGTSGNITVTANNTCGNSSVQTLSVTVNAIPATPGTISGLSSMCVGAGASTYSVSSIVGATSYAWSLPVGWNGTSTSNSISATPGSSGTISVTASNACGTSAAQNLSVTINALPTIVYTQNPDTVCANAGDIALGSVTPLGGTFSGTAVTGANFNATTAGAGMFTITYTYTDANSCTNSASQNIMVDLCTSISNPSLDESNFVVFPNPANELVTITSNESVGQLIIYNTLGAILYSKQLGSAQAIVDISAYQSGIYFIQLQTEKGVKTQKIIKQ